MVSDTFKFLEDFKREKEHIVNAYIVSFDVVSLFTNIPVENTIAYILKTLPKDALPFDHDTLRKLLRMACFETTISFQ